MTKKTYIFFALAGMALLVVGAASAEDESTFIYTLETTETFELPEGPVVNVFVQRGFTIFDNPDHPLHMSNTNCYGTLVADSETTFIGSGYCTFGVKAGGGGFWASWVGDQNGGTFTITRGGGSLDGITGGGSYDITQGGQWPDGKAFIRVSGTYNMPAP